MQIKASKAKESIGALVPENAEGNRFYSVGGLDRVDMISGCAPSIRERNATQQGLSGGEPSLPCSLVQLVQEAAESLPIVFCFIER